VGVALKRARRDGTTHLLFDVRATLLIRERARL
jgi:hypothetical protein